MTASFLLLCIASPVCYLFQFSSLFIIFLIRRFMSGLTLLFVHVTAVFVYLCLQTSNQKHVRLVCLPLFLRTMVKGIGRLQILHNFLRDLVSYSFELFPSFGQCHGIFSNRLCLLCNLHTLCSEVSVSSLSSQFGICCLTLQLLQKLAIVFHPRLGLLRDTDQVIYLVPQRGVTGMFREFSNLAGHCQLSPSVLLVIMPGQLRCHLNRMLLRHKLTTCCVAFILEFLSALPHLRGFDNIVLGQIFILRAEKFIVFCLFKLFLESRLLILYSFVPLCSLRSFILGFLSQQFDLFLHGFHIIVTLCRHFRQINQHLINPR
mmetsp:Transcript_894/g.1947  ORF Transcript_894/g.1947 Transcript_894/m.1947 type:complete len:318 (-) Transcript_894:190-1143(-)